MGQAAMAARQWARAGWAWRSSVTQVRRCGIDVDQAECTAGLCDQGDGDEGRTGFAARQGSGVGWARFARASTVAWVRALLIPICFSFFYLFLDRARDWAEKRARQLTCGVTI
ncbi:hypothetical protein M0R45_026264 [Rubus argutus]|uniref:Uncharacterized protein n=1 Tax=Rubus argutus TaxID=59490 RepID=A0AAW1WZK6_RUBAR